MPSLLLTLLFTAGQSPLPIPSLLLTLLYTAGESPLPIPSLLLPLLSTVGHHFYSSASPALHNLPRVHCPFLFFCSPYSSLLPFPSLLLTLLFTADQSPLPIPRPSPFHCPYLVLASKSGSEVMVRAQDDRMEHFWLNGISLRGRTAELETSAG